MLGAPPLQRKKNLQIILNLKFLCFAFGLQLRAYSWLAWGIIWEATDQSQVSCMQDETEFIFSLLFLSVSLFYSPPPSLSFFIFWATPGGTYSLLPAQCSGITPCCAWGQCGVPGWNPATYMANALPIVPSPEL